MIWQHGKPIYCFCNIDNNYILFSYGMAGIRKTGILASVIRRRLEMDTLEAVGMVLFLLDLCLSILAIPLLICILFLV